MGRTQTQLDEQLYDLSKKRAFAERTSMTAIRKAGACSVASSTQRPVALESFTFIGSGRSQSGGPQPLSERHDDALAEDFQARDCE